MPVSRLLPPAVRRLFGLPVKPLNPPYVLIDQPGQLEPLLAALERVDEVAVDTEADNMNRFRTAVCLLQFYADGKLYLVDALAPINLDPLWEILAKKHLIMHGSDFDLRLLSDLCGFKPKSLFDSLFAAQLLNYPRVGLASLLEEHFSVKLAKENQKANWSKRPLTKKLLDYASLDVYYLPELRDILMRKINKLGRADWLAQQCQRQIDSGMLGFPPDDEHAWRIGKSDKLRNRGLALLHALWHWRQEQAEKLNTPPFKVCGNNLLVEIAARAEDGDSAQTVITQTNLGRRHPRLIKSFATAVEKGFATDPAGLPRRPRNRDRNPLKPAEIALQDRIKNERDKLAAKLELDPTLIANRSQLTQIARDPTQVETLLLPWQAELMRSLPALAPGAATEKQLPLL